MEARRPLLALLLLFSAGVAGAQGVYKWVDAEGRTHFSGTPPPGAKANRLELKPAVPEPATPVAQKSWQEKLGVANERRLQEQKQAAAATQSKQENEQRCLEAQRALDILKRDRPIFRVNAQGEREYMEDDQRQANLESANKRVATYCR